ncbi:MAG: hypothetical protein WCF81_19335 [Roseiarcus sp.]
MNLLKRASAHSTAAFGLPILLSVAILVAHASSVRAADKMVGGEFATKGIVTSTIGPNDAKGQPASVLTFTDDEVKKLRDGHYSAALLFQTSSDWADAVTRGAEDEFKTLGVEIAGSAIRTSAHRTRLMRFRRSWRRSRPESSPGPLTRMN